MDVCGDEAEINTDSLIEKSCNNLPGRNMRL